MQKEAEVKEADSRYIIFYEFEQSGSDTGDDEIDETSESARGTR